MPTSPIIKGISTIKWGTKPGGTDYLGTPAGSIVESLSRKPKVDKGVVEDGDGFTVTTVLMNDGFDATAKCVYDSTKTYPAVGDFVTLKSALDSTGKSCLVMSITDDAERKKENMVTIELEYRPNVTS